MADNTTIEWTDATWNPVRGCSRISPGCGGPNHQGGCYAETIAARFSGPGQPFEGLAERTPHGGRWTGKMDVAWNMVDQPIRWRRPRRIFANSMSDLFHKDLLRDDVAMIYGTAIAAVHLRGHTFQILTKRADHMRELLSDDEFWEIANAHASSLVLEHTDPLNRRSDDARATCGEYGPDAPPPGIWLGVSTEDQARADERIPHLLATPAAKRFISAEPLLGAININDAVWAGTDDPTEHMANGIDWVIAGGESGTRARPMHPDWVRSLRDQCAAANVPFFFKQWGAWRPEIDRDRDDPDWRRDYGVVNRKPDRFAILNLEGGCGFHGERVHLMAKAAKSDNGAELDGKLHREFPT